MSFDDDLEVVLHVEANSRARGSGVDRLHRAIGGGDGAQEEARVGVARGLIEARQVGLGRREVEVRRRVGEIVVDVVEAALEAGLDAVASR